MSADLDPTLARANPKTWVPLKIEEMLAAAAMAALCLITLGNVVARYLTSYSFAFTEEYSIFLMLVVTLLAGGVAEAGNRHIRITFFLDRLPPRGRRIGETVTILATALLLGILVWLGARLAYDEHRFEVTSPGLGLQQWQYTVWLPILLLAVLGRNLGRLVRLWRPRP